MVADRQSVEMVMSTIGVLSLPSQQPVTIDEKNLEQILTRPLTIGQSGLALLVSSQRDQIEVITAGNLLNVRDLSGRKEFSQSKVPDVLEFFLKISSPQLSSYGVNFIITVPCSEPERWIRDNILSAEISVKTGKTLLGSGAVLKIAADPKTWNIKLGAGESNKVSVDFNAHEDTREVPSSARLRQEMEEQFDSMLTFLAGLGL